MKKPELVFAGKKNFQENMKVSTHIHSCPEIVLYVSCNGKTMIGDTEYDIKSGDIAVISANSPHNETHYDKSKLFYFGFEFNNELLPLTEGVYSKINGIERLSHIVERIYNEVRNQDIGHEQMISALLTEFIVLFGRGIRPTRLSDRSLEYLANYFKENYAQQMNMIELVENYGFDYERFRKEFKEQYGLAPKQFVVEQRLINAYSMLSEMSISCTDVAMLCGFSDSSQFSKMFKKRYGFSPEKMRKAKN